MLKFGLTGSIAVGKSTVSKTLIQLGIPIVDADLVARQIVLPGTVGLTSIEANFGKEYILPDGNLDRVKLGELVFSNATALNELNSITASLITEEANKQFEVLEKLGHKLACWDAALIIEAGNADKFRPLIVVACDKATQISRLTRRNGLTAGQAVRRIGAQLSTAEKVKFADFIIDTNSTIENSIAQTKNIVEKLNAKIQNY